MQVQEFDVQDIFQKLVFPLVVVLLFLFFSHTYTMATNQMLRSLLSSANHLHLARTHLFLSSRGGLSRNQFWPQSMASDVLVYDFQDGCPPGARGNVFTGLQKAHEVYPNKYLKPQKISDVFSFIFNIRSLMFLVLLFIGMRRRKLNI